MNEKSFLINKEYRKFVEFCEACQKYQYIGLCYGPPGVGKTWSARQFSRWDLIEYYDDSYLERKEPPSAEVLSCTTAFYTAPAIPGNKIENGIRSARLTLTWVVEEARASQENREKNRAIVYMTEKIRLI